MNDLKYQCIGCDKIKLTTIREYGFLFTIPKEMKYVCKNKECIHWDEELEE